MDKDIERVFKKGGTVHFSLARGVIAHVKGEKPKQIIEPMERLGLSDERPPVIYL